MSLASFIAYAIDKRRAQSDSFRIPERSLHLLDLLGGWPGGWIARRTLRHKTRKASFVVKYWITVVIHLVCLWLCYAAMA